jgi:fumarylacetoacetate (FAA) hydrolase family protein
LKYGAGEAVVSANVGRAVGIAGRVPEGEVVVVVAGGGNGMAGMLCGDDIPVRDCVVRVVGVVVAGEG